MGERKMVFGSGCGYVAGRRLLDWVGKGNAEHAKGAEGAAGCWAGCLFMTTWTIGGASQTARVLTCSQSSVPSQATGEEKGCHGSNTDETDVDLMWCSWKWFLAHVEGASSGLNGI